ncbi:MAG: antibiotic biosynthesis monooxygenase [Pseudomonadota bacterium]
MYIAMNRFKVPPENADAFEAMWLGRESHLHKLDGFVEFHMLKGPIQDGMVLYASHTVWASEDDFIAWTKSQSFRDAHKGAGKSKSLHSGHPQFEGFSAIQHIKAEVMA